MTTLRIIHPCKHSWKRSLRYGHFPVILKCKKCGKVADGHDFDLIMKKFKEGEISNQSFIHPKSNPLS